MSSVPPGEGKSYILHKVGELFPPQDVMFVAGMTDKAVFHRRGSLVIKNEVGEYETIEEKIAKIDSVIEDKESEVAISKDANLKQVLRNEVKELEKQKKDLHKNACKLIDLSHKIIVFLDTPNSGLLLALMPVLSHDKYEVEYEFVVRDPESMVQSWKFWDLSRKHVNVYRELRHGNKGNGWTIMEITREGVGVNTKYKPRGIR